MEDLSLSVVGTGSSPSRAEQEDQDHTAMQKSALEWRKLLLLFLGVPYRILYPYSRSHREEQFGVRRGETKVGDTTIIHLQAMHSKENSASHCALFSSCPYMFWNCIEKSKGLYGKSPLQTRCLKAGSITQTRDPGHG